MDVDELNLIYYFLYFNLYVGNLHVTCMLMMSNATLLPIKMQLLSFKNIINYMYYIIFFLLRMFRQLFHKRSIMFLYIYVYYY